VVHIYHGYTESPENCCAPLNFRLEKDAKKKGSEKLSFWQKSREGGPPEKKGKK